LAYTHRTLYAHPIDLDWVAALNQRDELCEKIDAYVSRFGRLQDHIGEKLKEWIEENLTGQSEIARCRLAIRIPLLSGGVPRGS
jgi:hypothetical protein